VLNQLYKKLSKGLKKHHISYIITGGQAAMLYREPRYTNDIDITVGIGTEDADKLFE